MRKVNLPVSAAFLIHALGWFLPVVKGGVTLPQGLPGWQAFRAAACAVWPYEGMNIERGYNVVLVTISAGTTVLFVLVSGWVVAFGSPRLHRASAWIAAVAFVVNAQWVVQLGSDWVDLRAGYYLWWFSFILLALGLFGLSSRSNT